MTQQSPVQEVPLNSPVSPAAAELATRILDTGTRLDDAYVLSAEH